MSELNLARDLILILLSAFIGGTAAKKLRLPLLVGYLFSGMIIGSIFGSFLPLEPSIKSIAEIGVALLLFTLGLEFSLTRLKELGDVIILGSFIQICLSIIAAIIIFPLLGMDFYTSLFLGAVFSLSSTAVVIKTLSDRGELDSLHGQISAGWLLMQDLYTLPMIILLPAVGIILQGNQSGLASFFLFGKSIFIAFGIFLTIIILGKKIVPYFLEKIAEYSSRELLFLASLILCLIFAYVFYILGFSFALGAFIAGLILSSSPTHYSIFAEVRPLRDLFATVFFVSLGFIIDPAFILSSWPVILMLTLFIIFLKLIISSVILLILGYHSKVSSMVGFSLVSVGEFAFLLALVGLGAELINRNTYMTILSVSFLSLIVAVPLLTFAEKIYYSLKKLMIKKIPKAKAIFDRFDKITFNKLAPDELSGHIVILGHGRVGKYISRAISNMKIPYVVVDYNYHVIKHLKSQAVNVIYGDPAEIDVLRFAKVDKAKTVILAFADRHIQESVITNILTINAKVNLIARSHFDEDHKKLKSLGVSAVVHPEFEAALTIAKKLLEIHTIEKKDIEMIINNLEKDYGLAMRM